MADVVVVVNPEFQDGYGGWFPLGCQISVVGPPTTNTGLPPDNRLFCCLASSRTEAWHGIAQEVGNRLRERTDYDLQAWVSVVGDCDAAPVMVTLKLQNGVAAPHYLTLAREVASRGKWTLLKGKLRLESHWDKALVYLEGPPPGVSLLLASLHITLEVGAQLNNVVLNPKFESGTLEWSTTKSCLLSTCRSSQDGMIEARAGSCFAVVSRRTASWQGPEQDLASRLSQSTTYSVTAHVAVSGGSHEVIATLRVEEEGSDTRYITVGRAVASSKAWTQVHGNFCLEAVVGRAVFYVEGPPPGVDLYVDSVRICPSESDQADMVKDGGTTSVCHGADVLHNWNFQDGLKGWTSTGGKLFFSDPEKCAIVAARTAEWQGIQQDVSGRIEQHVAYHIAAVVKVRGSANASVIATLYTQEVDASEQYIPMGRTEASAADWVELAGNLILYKLPRKAVAYLEGPPSGVDILVRSFSMTRAEKPQPSQPPVIHDPKYGVNMVDNSSYSKGLDCWYALGSCHLHVANDGPSLIPPVTNKSKFFWKQEPESGSRCVIATRRSYDWEGPAQTVTDRLQLFLTYQVAAWVRVSPSAGPQKLNIALGVDDGWVNGGEVESDPSGNWTEISGSFRLERKPKKVIVYLQGPAPGVDTMLAGLRIFAVDHKARITWLKEQTDKVRKRDVVVTLRDGDGHIVPSQSVHVQQTSNSFPLGSCINRRSLDNPGYVKFFLEHFNWAVFENEMKWNWTEPHRGQSNYRDADELVEFCSKHRIPVRGHCIFWEVEHTIQDWVKQLSKAELEDAVQGRIIDLLGRYQGKFQHYDVNNEMMHGSFFKDRLGCDVIPYMFKLSHQFDPSARLFVNDYHVEDGCDARSSPEKYVEHIRHLHMQGAPVHGIGVQGHIAAPVGSILRRSFNVLSTIGCPIWMTEVDVSSSNQYICADDVEVVLREAFAHAGVQGILLWGFWEGAMSRENAHLVNWDMSFTEAGKRLQALQHEWLTSITSHADAGGTFAFRGFLGQYKLSIQIAGQRFQQIFEVTKGDGPLLIDIQLALH